MKLVKAFLVIGATVVAFTSHEAVAEKCSGYVSMKREPSVEIMKKADGSQVLRVLSSRILNMKEPKDYPLDGAYGTCAGLWTVAADGKSGSGAGECYYVDRDGDTMGFAWEGTNTGGTWKVQWGTGKYKNTSNSGTWKPDTARYSDGWAWQSWEGECSPVK
jgi:hypothetical protein